MKKFLIILFVPISFLFVQCNSEEVEEENIEGTEQTIDLGDVDEIDLEEYGFQIKINVPAKSSTVPEPTIDVLDWGAVEIRVGKNYQIQISASDGDIAQRKSDINMDDVYETSFIVDETNVLFYSSKVRGAELDPEFHFFVIISDGDKAYEVEDIKGETYSEPVANRMLNFAKAIKIKPSA